MFAWIHYWKTTLQEKLHAAMAWKQRRSQYQDHFPGCDPGNFSGNSVPKMRAFNHAAKVLKLEKDWDKTSRAVSGRAYYGTNSVPDLMHYDLVTCPLYWTVARSDSPEGWTQTQHTQHFSGVGPEAELTSNNLTCRGECGWQEVDLTPGTLPRDLI